MALNMRTLTRFSLTPVWDAISRMDISPIWNSVYASRRIGGSFANASLSLRRRYSTSEAVVEGREAEAWTPCCAPP